MLFGIDVIIVAPGPVKTPIWSKGDEEANISAYQNSPYFPALQKHRTAAQHLADIGLPAQKIAETVYEALTLPHPKVRYQLAPDPMRHLMTAYLPTCMVGAGANGRLPSSASAARPDAGLIGVLFFKRFVRLERAIANLLNGCTSSAGVW